MLTLLERWGRPLHQGGRFHHAAYARRYGKGCGSHIDWIETQQELIEQVGLENYLSEQIHKEG